MYGIPQEITRQYKIEVELQDRADLEGLVLALKKKLPDLEGPVISRGQTRLTEQFSFIINGQSQPPESSISLHPNDRVVLVLMATGG